MLDVFKPGRYINREWNSVHKSWDAKRLKVALCFPDIYEIGMSHLGMKILYGLLNSREDILCERVFAPWSDKEKNMLSKNEKLSSLESSTPLSDFDIVGFSLQYEMSYPDVLNMLNLGGVPVLLRDRSDKDPIVIAGGPCTFNPEPMADFIDVFIIGEAEEAIVEIIDGSRLKASATADRQGSRQNILRYLSKIDGVYVPALSHEPGALSVKKRIIRNLDNSFFPTDIVVPYISIVHDRIGIEIMRGCPHSCKFCQACKIFKPLRIRSVESIMEIAEKSIKNTGYEEISLLSLSTGDYPHLEELSAKMEERFSREGVKVSFPSLRVKNLEAHREKGLVRKAGLTFAPEAGNDTLRIALGKNIKNEDIIKKSIIALKSGWKKVKLYFMIGLPGETREDLDSIVELASGIRSVSVSVSDFIPKPHSDFENEAMNGLDELKEKTSYLRYRFQERRFSVGGRSRRTVSFHKPEMSRIEGILSRGDRVVGRAIHSVWKKGLRLQAWDDFFDYSVWQRSFEKEGIDDRSYLKKSTDSSELPWGFIQA